MTEPGAVTTTERCPFRHCNARVKVVHHKGLDLGTPAVNLILSHSCEPRPFFESCPASLMAWPIEIHEENLLEELAVIIDNKLRAEAARTPPRVDRPAPVAPEEKPRPQNPLFTWNGGGSHGEPIYGHHRMKPVPTAAPTPTKGGAGVASVAETRARLDRANELIAEAQGLALAAGQKFADAQAELYAIRDTSTEPLGVPIVAQAIEACETAASLSTPAIESNAQYGRNL